MELKCQVQNCYSEGVHRQLFPRCRCRQYITHDFQHKSQENEDSHAKVTYPTFHLRHGILQTTFTNASPTWLHLHIHKIRFDPYNAQVMTWLQHYISKPIHKPAPRHSQPHSSTRLVQALSNRVHDAYHQKHLQQPSQLTIG